MDYPRQNIKNIFWKIANLINKNEDLRDIHTEV